MPLEYWCTKTMDRFSFIKRKIILFVELDEGLIG